MRLEPLYPRLILTLTLMLMLMLIRPPGSIIAAPYGLFPRFLDHGFIPDQTVQVDRFLCLDDDLLLRVHHHRVDVRGERYGVFLDWSRRMESR